VKLYGKIPSGELVAFDPPTTRAYLDGPRTKIERAQKHIRDLDFAIRAFCDSEPYTLGINKQLEISHIAIYVKDAQPVPREISTTLGDAIHNLRSAFDHVMYLLVKAARGDLTDRIYFPICKTLEQYKSAFGKREIYQVGDAAVKLLRSVQPHITGDDTLWHINELDRVDKHRLLLTVIAVTNSWQVPIFRSMGLISLRLIGGPLVAGDEVVRIPESTYEKMNRDVKLGLDVRFGDSEIVAGKPVLETLNYMADFSGAIISQFEPFV
jgi:hypothetical protein